MPLDLDAIEKRANEAALHYGRTERYGELWHRPTFSGALAESAADVPALVARVRELEERVARYEGPVSDSDYVLLSAKWTRGDNIVWWGPRSNGYYFALPSIGRYAEEEARSIVADLHGDTWAVPLSFALEHARLVVPNGISKFEAFNPERGGA